MMLTGPEAKALRLATGLDYKTFATLLGVKHARTVHSVESGHRPAGVALERLWRLLAEQHAKQPVNIA